MISEDKLPASDRPELRKRRLQPRRTRRMSYTSPSDVV